MTERVSTESIQIIKTRPLSHNCNVDHPPLYLACSPPINEQEAAHVIGHLTLRQTAIFRALARATSSLIKYLCASRFPLLTAHPRSVQIVLRRPSNSTYIQRDSDAA